MTQIKDSLIGHLERVIPGYDQELRKLEVAQMLWMLIEPSNRHSHHANSINIGSRQLNKLFGKSPNFQDINRHVGSRYFRVHNHQNNAGKESHNQGYEPAPWLKKAFDDYLSNDSIPSELLDEAGKKIRKPRPGISSLTKDKNPAVGWKGVYAPNLVSVNIDNLKQLERYFRDRYEASTLNLLSDSDDMSSEAYAKRIHCSAGLRDIATNINFPSQIPHRYIQAKSGRLYTEGLSLQNCPKEVRIAALAGCWDYDISCCHFAILEQMASRFGVECPTIRAYVSNKKVFRKNLANEVGISVEQAKGVLTSTIYGSIESVRPIDAIPKQIGIAASEALYKNKTYKLLKGEIKNATKKILEEHPVQRGLFVNEFRLGISQDKGKKSIMAHLLQGVEACALRSAISGLDENLVLLQHDGFTTRGEINRDALQKRVLQDTGYNLVFEAIKLAMPNPTYMTEDWYIDLKSQNSKKPNKHKGFKEIFTSFGYTIAPELWDIPPVFPNHWEFDTPF